MKGYNELKDWQCKKNHKVWGTLTMRSLATKEELTRANKHFFNCVNRILFGNQYKRKGTKIDAFSTLQQMANGNWHLHFSTEKADEYSIEEYIRLLTNIWRNKVKGSGRYEVEEIKNKEAVITYQLHDYYKLGNDTLALS